jgi:hypothetical protein
MTNAEFGIRSAETADAKDAEGLKGRKTFTRMTRIFANLNSIRVDLRKPRVLAVLCHFRAAGMMKFLSTFVQPLIFPAQPRSKAVLKHALQALPRLPCVRNRHPMRRGSDRASAHASGHTRLGMSLPLPLIRAKSVCCGPQGCSPCGIRGNDRHLPSIERRLALFFPLLPAQFRLW